MLSFILALPDLGSMVAFNAATSIAAFGLYFSFGADSPQKTTFLVHLLRLSPVSSLTNVSLGLPIALRVIYPDRFVQGPFYLGKFSYPIAIVSTLWISFMLIVLCLPEINPVNSKTLNYAPVALGVVVVVYALGFWVISARKWFVGPVKRIEGACHV
jgi:hypothetical protein